jgi:hypothetical protein
MLSSLRAKICTRLIDCTYSIVRNNFKSESYGLIAISGFCSARAFWTGSDLFWSVCPSSQIVQCLGSLFYWLFETTAWNCRNRFGLLFRSEEQQWDLLQQQQRRAYDTGHAEGNIQPCHAYRIVSTDMLNAWDYESALWIQIELRRGRRGGAIVTKGCTFTGGSESLVKAKVLHGQLCLVRMSQQLRKLARNLGRNSSELMWTYYFWEYLSWKQTQKNVISDLKGQGTRLEWFSGVVAEVQMGAIQKRLNRTLKHIDTRPLVGEVLTCMPGHP